MIFAKAVNKHHSITQMIQYYNSLGKFYSSYVTGMIAFILFL